MVQRPASVVKELVENSMDAGADQITVEIEKGGRALIRVSDNGQGLSRDDALLAIERYATSKIFAKEDLFSISTFGFRGEALPSIASVSKFSLISRLKEASVGTSIHISGGKLDKVSDAGAPSGTMVEVKQLFFNTPARRKFLKAESTENSHISDAVSGLAMGNPSIGFRLFLNKKLVRHFPPGQDIRQRAQMVLGKDAAPHLYPLDYTIDEISISGVCANPGVTRSTANRVYLFVNKRLVKDPGLVAALFQGYRGRIMKGRYPMGAICIDLPYSGVDVNVHPAKREIKFLNPQPVYKALAVAVSQTMSQAQTQTLAYARSGPVTLREKASTLFPPRAKEPSESLVPEPEKSLKKIPDQAPPVGYVLANEPEDAVAQPDPSWSRESGEKIRRGKEPTPSGKISSGSSFERVVLESRSSAREPIIDSAQIESPAPSRVVGQVLGTYIVVEKDQHLVLVDQHAAHERITYEELKKRHQGLGIQSQDLMVPEVLELTHREADLLQGILGDLEGLGVRIEPFGGTSFVIKSIPILLDDKAIGPFIMEMVETLSRDNEMGAKDKWLDDCLVTMACHRAIRANKPMHLQEMEKLLADLWKCENPMHCPHGRPILVAFDANQLEKLFKRVV